MNKEDYKIAYENVMVVNKMLEQEIERLNNIIDKAIEYIENNVLTYIDVDNLESITDKEENEVLNILRGDKE